MFKRRWRGCSVPNIRSIEGLLPESYDRTLVGVVVDSGGLKVNVQGNVLAARWADPVVASAGDTVLVQLIIGRTGQTEAIVRARVTANPRPARGTVSSVPPSSDTVSVTGSDGVTYTAYFVTAYTPVVNDEVFLSWFGNRPTIMGKVAAVPVVASPIPPPSPAAPPPPPPQSGTSFYAATDSATYWPPGGWNSWAGGNGRVFQGQYGSGQVYGAWWYAGSPGQLAGRTINRFRIRLGPRLAVGSYNSPVTVHFYVTNNTNRPGGNVTHVAGPHNVGAGPGQGAVDYDLPVSWATNVINGGGMAIMGDPYAGFRGRNEFPESGLLIFDWSM